MEKYSNFSAAIYCPVNDLINITDLDQFSKSFAWIEKHVRVGKVYLETYRHGTTIKRGQIEGIRDFFCNKGIETSGGGLRRMGFLMGKVDLIPYATLIPIPLAC